ncbi:hypothetical protein ACT4MK_16150 [Bradyrhizobium barranii]|uniref:hypothetical protein n=1 Tax=Bradyrhizobium TaxID=374 RepID=UPI003F25186A
MPYQKLPLTQLLINRANDRHGELENETAAIAWLFNENETHMRNLAKDIAETSEIYEAPLVYPDRSNYLVFDGNRRTTCLKLLHAPRRAPTIELQDYFTELAQQCSQNLPAQVECEVETDRDRIDEILFRRHTGSQSGIGQSKWTDRMKSNFIDRTGKGGTTNVASEIEIQLRNSDLPAFEYRIPWSTMNRLLSAEVFRNRVGFSIKKGHFTFTHQEPVVLRALNRIATDLAQKEVVLGDLWDVEGKRHYLDKLEAEGVLPSARHSLPISPPTSIKTAKPSKVAPRPSSPPRQNRQSLIPDTHFPIAWPGRLQRHRAIWEELQFTLRLKEHPNAISVLFRVLLELSIDNYLSQTSLPTAKPTDSLAKKAVRIADDLFAKGKIDKKYLDLFQKFPQYDGLVSSDTLNRYVHSPNFAPSPEHLTALWDTLADFVVHCLNA